MTLTIRHNAPTLNSTGACPSCGAPIEPEAALCTGCGMDFTSGKRIREAGGRWKRLVPGILVLAILIAGLLVFFRIDRNSEALPEEVDSIAPVVTEVEVAAVPPKVEDPRAAFEAKKLQATQQAREKLDDLQPLAQIGEAVELRRKNGLLDRGTLQGYSGSGTGRVAIIATARGEVGVPLTALDKPSRRRADPEYREQFLQHLLSQKPSEGTED